MKDRRSHEAPPPLSPGRDDPAHPREFPGTARCRRTAAAAAVSPNQINGWALAGICLIRLETARPAWAPRWLGIGSENAAHRIAVEWADSGLTRVGVFITRRDTDSLWNRLAGGRLFPGVHHPAQFRCADDGNRFEVELNSKDREARVHVVAKLADAWPEGSVFRSLDEASAFFRGGCGGWSPAHDGCALEGVELHTDEWSMQPLAVERAESSFFADRKRFPAGSVEFDSALLMRGIRHEWRALGRFGGTRREVVPPHPHHRLAALFELP